VSIYLIKTLTSNPEKMEDERIKIEVAKLRKAMANLKLDAELERHDNYIAAEILLKLLEKKPVSNPQIEFLKNQSIDFSKVLAIIGLQVIPGSSIAIVLLEKVAEKHGFSLFPDPNRKIPEMD
jgi:hypothetical protein